MVMAATSQDLCALIRFDVRCRGQPTSRVLSVLSVLGALLGAGASTDRLPELSVSGSSSYCRCAQPQHAAQPQPDVLAAELLSACS